MIGHYVLGALRNIRRNKLASAIKLLALSLGLFCFLTAYVFADFVGRADTHWANAGRIYALEQESVDGNERFAAGGGSSAPAAKYLRLDVPELEAVARITGPTGVSAPELISDPADQLLARGADADLLTIFDLPFVAGDSRNALAEPGGAVITADLARRLFGGVQEAIGQSMRLEVLNPRDVTVTGVIEAIRPPSALALPFGRFDILLTMGALDDVSMPILPTPPANATPEQIASVEAARRAFRRSEMEDWRTPFSETFVLLPPDDRLADILPGRLEDFAARRVPSEQGIFRFELASLETAMAERIDQMILRGAGYSLRGLLYGFGALVLVVACLNFANLTTAEAAARGREIGLRKTIGAGRGQIALQTLTETLLLAVTALVLMLAALGLGLAAWETSRNWGLTLPALERPGFWAGMGAIVIGVSLLAGAYPALALARVSPLAAHRAGSPAAARGTARALLTGAQFAAAAALLTGVFVIWMQNERMRRSALDLTEDPVVLITLTGIPRAGATSMPGNDVMRAELMVDPAVLSFSTSMSPLFGAATTGQERLRRSPDENTPGEPYQQRLVGFDFFRTLGVPVIAGREFRDDDQSVLGQSPGIIDAHTARRLGMTPQSAVGQTLYISRPSASFRDGAVTYTNATQEVEIIGVIEEPPFELRASDSDFYVWSYMPMTGFQYFLRVDRNDVPGALAHIRDTFATLTPDRLANIRFVDEEFEQAFRMFSRITAGLMALCLMAVAIAAMGLFGMASFTVQRRIREIGVRKTLGASSLSVLGLLLWDFSKPVLVANLIAWPVAWIASQAWLNLFADRIALTPWPFAAALLVSLAVAWLAVGAARAKPARVLQTG